ncbi:hypothetical protein ACHAQK_011233, partial [Fusarium lateritium]
IAAISDSPECVEILLKLWENILPCQGLPQKTGYVFKSYSVLLESRLDVAIGKAMAFVNGWDDVGLTQLHLAAWDGGDMQTALREEPWAIDQFDETGRSPVHSAISADNYKGLEKLIQAGANVNQRDYLGFTPLMNSASLGRELMMQKLLEHIECRRWIDSGYDAGKTALHYAISQLFPRCVRLLLDAGASASKLTSSRETCLHLLASSLDSNPQAALDIFHLLQTRGFNLEARDVSGYTPILGAVWHGNVTVFNALVSAGASLDVTNSAHLNILMQAAYSKDFKIIDQLSRQNLDNIDPQLIDINRGLTALGALHAELTDPYPVTFHEHRPSPDQQQAFITLYFSLLIRDLECLMSTLKEICLAAEERDFATATTLLNILIKKNDTSFRHDHAGWYRGLQVYVKDGKWDPFKEAISEEYMEMSEKLHRVHIAKEKTIKDPEMEEFFYA